jgi:hypothetical protein
MKKWKALIFMQVAIASNFIVLGFIFYNETEYKKTVLYLSIIGALACVYEAVKIYRKNKT